MQLFRVIAIGTCCAALALPLSSFAQSGMNSKSNAAPVGSPVSPANTLAPVFNAVSGQVISAAEAMPAEKYDFAPNGQGDFKGVRSFGDQVRHLAQANYGLIHGWGVAGEIDPKTLDSLKTKDELVKALRDSFAYEQAAINSITPENAFVSIPGPKFAQPVTRVSAVTFAMAHAMDHYGQLVEYLRMNGIIPPASRK